MAAQPIRGARIPQQGANGQVNAIDALPAIVAVAGLPSSVHESIEGVGKKVFECIVNFALPLPLLERNAYEEMFLRSHLGDKDFQLLMRSEGVKADGMGYEDITLTGSDDKGKLNWDPAKLVRANPLMTALFRSRTEWPKLSEMFMLWNRGLIDDSLADAILRFNGIADRGIRQVISDLRFEIPPNSDLIRWAVRHAFDVDVIEEFKYLDEIPTQLYDLSYANGWGGKTGVQYPAGKDNKGGAVAAHEAKWFDMEWVAHWILPSAGQGYEMLHRLYPESRFGPSPTITPGTEFTVSNLKTLLRAQDVPPFWRDRLIALSYNPLTRVDIRRMYQLKQLKREDVYHAYRQNGYDDANAWRLTQYTEEQVRQADIAKHGKPAVKLICKAYELGAISKDQAKGQIADLLQSQDDADKEISRCDTERSLARLGKLIESIHKRFVSGKLDQGLATSLLLKVGVMNDAVSLYIGDWVIEKDLHSKEISAAEATKWFKLGYYDSNDLLITLQNLGYDDKTANMILQIALDEMAVAKTRALEARAKQLEKNLAKQRQLQKQMLADYQSTKKQRLAQQKGIEKDQLALIKAKLKGITTKNLKAWYANKAITREELTQYLILMEWPAHTIKLWIDQLEREISHKLASPVVTPKTPKPATEG